MSDCGCNGGTDIGWAIERMREGQIVRRGIWPRRHLTIVQGIGICSVEPDTREVRQYVALSDDLMATDWQAMPSEPMQGVHHHG